MISKWQSNTNPNNACLMVSSHPKNPNPRWVRWDHHRMDGGPKLHRCVGSPDVKYQTSCGFKIVDIVNRGYPWIPHLWPSSTIWLWLDRIRHGKIHPFLSSVNHLFRLGPSIPWRTVSHNQRVTGKIWGINPLGKTGHQFSQRICSDKAMFAIVWNPDGLSMNNHH